MQTFINFRLIRYVRYYFVNIIYNLIRTLFCMWLLCINKLLKLAGCWNFDSCHFSANRNISLPDTNLAVGCRKSISRRHYCDEIAKVFLRKIVVFQRQGSFLLPRVHSWVFFIFSAFKNRRKLRFFQSIFLVWWFCKHGFLKCLLRICVLPLHVEELNSPKPSSVVLVYLRLEDGMDKKGSRLVQSSAKGLLPTDSKKNQG